MNPIHKKFPLHFIIGDQNLSKLFLIHKMFYKNINYFPFFSRPKRERKLPAHLKAGDFEYSYKGPNDTAKNREAAAEKAALAETALSAKTALNTTADQGNLLRGIDNKTVKPI